VAQIAIDFLLGDGILSQAIAWFGLGSRGYSHCASVLKDGRYLDARVEKIGVVPAGVHIREPLTEGWIRKRRATLEVPMLEYMSWECNLRAKITDHYGDRDIWDFVLGADEHTPGRWICSALAINAIQHIKRLPYPMVVPAHQITPNTLLLILQAAGFTIGEEITQ
jgi:hypothetical protein